MAVHQKDIPQPLVYRKYNVTMVDLQHIIQKQPAPFLGFPTRAGGAKPTFAPIRHHFQIMTSFAHHELEAVPRISTFPELLHLFQHAWSYPVTILFYKLFPMTVLIEKYPL